MHRFCPDAKRLTDHSLSNIIAVGLFYCPLYWLAARQWDKLAATAVLDLNPIRCAVNVVNMRRHTLGHVLLTACESSDAAARDGSCRIFGTVWLFMVLHDCWFFFIHRSAGSSVIQIDCSSSPLHAS